MKTNHNLNTKQQRRPRRSYQSNNSIVKKLSLSKFPEQSKKYGLLRQRQLQQKQNSKLIIKPSKSNKKTLISSIKIPQAPRNNKRERFQLRLPSVSDSSSVLFCNTEWFKSLDDITPTFEVPLSTTKQETRTHHNLKSDKITISSTNGIITDNFSSKSLQQLTLELQAFAAYVRLRPMEHEARQILVQTISELAFSTFGQKKEQNQQHPNLKSNDTETSNPIYLQVFGSYATPLICTYCSDVDMALWGVVETPDTSKMPVDTWGEHNSRDEGENSEQQKELNHQNTCKPLVFVLDRKGEELVQDMTTKTGVENHLAFSSDSEADSAHKLEGLHTKHIFHSTKAFNNVEKNQHVYIIDENIDEDDTDFSLLELQQPPAKRQKVSNASDGDKCNDISSMNHYDKQDTTNLEVSIQSIQFSNNTLTPSSMGPVGNTRTLVLRALQTLKRGMHRLRIFANIEFRRHAKVPIVNMESRLGFEGDLAIGGHNGTDTSQFAKALVNRYKR
jgi:hypothetical protein